MSDVHPKVRAGGVAGAITVVLVWAASQVGVEIPAEVASALTTLISFGGGYLTSSD